MSWNDVYAQLTFPKIKKFRRLVTVYPALFSKRVPLLRSVSQISDDTRNGDTRYFRSDNVLRELLAISQRLSGALEVEHVYVDSRGRVVDDIFGDLEREVQRGGWQRHCFTPSKNCRHVRLTWWGEEGH